METQTRKKDHRAESVVLVELDALLDTRLPTLGSINSQAAVDCSKDPLYYERQIDDFQDMCGISKETFREAYQQRDNEIVMAAVITEMPFILHDLVLKLEQESIDTPFVSRVKVDVNVYPYEFDSEDREAIELAVMARCGVETEVRCVYVPPEVLTPQMVKERYSGLILYNFRSWLEHHVEAFKTVKMPRVSVLAPALFHDEVPDANEFLKDGMASHITAFQLSEVGCIELFALSLLPVANFSMARIPGHYAPKPASPVEDLRQEIPDEYFVK